ncbi:DUF4167 domain-containing protein [Sedimentitalea sp. XS_ASV28]|uniref:DUF4167 domain-containing protein n=1 Tax=Sedimentitalea sp. XS_ASV28 TaxID=3241296 RepID=UPI003519ACFE
MRSSKSRSRSKSNRNRSQGGGNVINRVFDSSGPEGKVRGTPQQIIEKYNQLARDAQLSNDRVATENFQQHAEHYLRLLSEAQREMESRREEQERQNRERQAERDRERAERQEREAAAATSQAPEPDATPEPQHQPDPGAAPQPDVLDLSNDESDESGLVETPENKAKKPARKPRTRKPATKADAPNETEAAPKKAAAPSRKPRTTTKAKAAAKVEATDNPDGGSPEAAE